MAGKHTDRILRRARAIHAVEAERDRQDTKWGTEYRHTPTEWLTILAEEFGEVAQHVCRGTFDDANLVASDQGKAMLKRELVQCAAVCVKWIEAIDEEIEGDT